MAPVRGWPSWGGLLLTLALIIMYAFVSNSSYNDALAERAQYCWMVKHQRWPDYRHIAKTECPAALKDSTAGR